MATYLFMAAAVLAWIGIEILTEKARRQWNR